VVITQDDVRTLAAFKGKEAPVTSCYLDVDGRSHPRLQEVEQQLASLLRRLRSRDGTLSPSTEEDLRRIEQHVRGGIDRSRVRGLAMFSCAADGFWKVVELPVRVTNQIVVNHMPAVSQLETVLEELRPMGVLLADRTKARAVVVSQGEIVVHEEIQAEGPRVLTDDRASNKTRAASSADAHVHRHERRAADLAFDLFRAHGVERVALGGPADLLHELDSMLHPYLRERVGEHLQIPVGASLDQIRKASLEAEERIERREEARLVERLRDGYASGRRAVVGLDDVVKALNERRVDTLLVSHGYTAEGWRCPCGHLALVGRSCPLCGRDMAKVADLVEDAVDEALTQSCRVEVCVGNADLDVLGRIGALLRF